MPSATAAPSLTIRQGRIDLSFHQVAGEVIAHVLKDPRLFLGGGGGEEEEKEDAGLQVDVDVASAPHEDAFAALQAGRTDMLIGWLDGSHGAYIDPFRSEVVVVGDEHEHATPAVYTPYCVWAVPSYIPAAMVPDVDSLAKPSVAARFATRVLQGINPGAGISRFSQEMISAYSLDKQGWSFQSGTQQDCFQTVEQRIARDEWFVVPLWHPQYLHARYKLRALTEPKGLLRSVDAARIIVRKAFLHTLSSSQQEALLRVLRRVVLRNDAVTQMDSYVHVDKMSYADAAKKWLRANQDRVDSWFASEGHDDIVRRAREVTSKGIPIAAPATAGAYLPYTLTHSVTPSIIHTSFQLPWDTTVTPYKLAHVGAVNDGVSEKEALQAVQLCALNLLAQLRDAADGDLGRVRLLRLEGFVATTDAKVNVPAILDAASNLLTHALGQQRGAHARTALILPSNPLNVPTMLGAVAELMW